MRPSKLFYNSNLKSELERTSKRKFDISYAFEVWYVYGMSEVYIINQYNKVKKIVEKIIELYMQKTLKEQY